MKWLVAIASLTGFLGAQDDGNVARRIVRQPWSAAVVATMESLPVQDGGRVKPLAALAAATLHLVHGRRDMKLDTDGDGKADVTLTPTEWLLDAWCFPEQAADYPLFRIENVEVLDAIGIAHEGGQRFDFEYLTYRQLGQKGRLAEVPGAALLRLASQYRKKSAQERTPVEAHLVDSAEQVQTYDSLHRYLVSLSSAFQIEGDEFQKRLGGKKEMWLSELMQYGDTLRTALKEYEQKSTAAEIGNLFGIASDLSDVVQSDHAMPALFPPDGTRSEHEEWLGLGALVSSGLGNHASKGQIAMLEQLQAAIGATDQTAREGAFVKFRDMVVARATERGEFAKVAQEAGYLRANWAYQSLHYFLLALVVVALGWVMPRVRLVSWAGIVATVVPLGMLVWDIVLRCFIRSRPPIVNLYDTFLFIAAVLVATAVVLEIISKRRVAIALAPTAGALLITLARAFEVEDGKDQMAPLQAVLDTNYYLATHVTSINTGYSAGMLASLLGTVWLLMQATGFRRGDVALHKAIVRATYGVTAFSLTFNVFGTIYGGVWANDSWGRFWGWDPKENGALLICLAQVALMHARLCGWVRDFGYCVFAALTGIVVTFSWFHVNLLGIGLHSYGFASSTKVALFTYYWVEAGVVAACVAAILLRHFVGADRKAAATASA